MAELNLEQQQLIRDWLAAGDSLSDVQRKLKDECGLVLTYMDVRLLALDLNAEVQDPDPPAQPEAADALTEDPTGPAPDAIGGVTVSLDRVMRPGAVVSGGVVFSDGTHGTWQIDQLGRFGVEPAVPGYQPSPEDMQDFQDKLRLELQRHGYG